MIRDLGINEPMRIVPKDMTLEELMDYLEFVIDHGEEG